MPHLHLDIRWPDGQRDCCYSPSRIIGQYFDRGQSYTVEEFLRRSREALNAAAERVRAKYGYYCSAAMDELKRIEERADQLDGQARKGQVDVIDLHQEPRCPDS